MRVIVIAVSAVVAFALALIALLTDEETTNETRISQRCCSGITQGVTVCQRTAALRGRGGQGRGVEREDRKSADA